MVNIELHVGGEKVMVKTHDKPHLDEIAAMWLIEKFGTAEFLEKYVVDGCLTIGVGGGPFDEHPNGGSQAKPNECSATLVAKTLGVEDDPALKVILNFVLIHDIQGGAQPFDLSILVKQVNLLYPDDPKRVIDWAMVALEAKYKEQNAFFEAVDDFSKNAKIEAIQIGNGQILKMAAINSDNPQMGKYARAKTGGQMDIFVQRDKEGHTCIFSDKRSGIGLSDVARVLRYMEQKARGKMVTTDWDELVAEGTVPGAEMWYYHREGQMLLNGSLTNPNVQPARLNLEQIQSIVRIALTPQLFPKNQAQKCLEGQCTSSAEQKCPWYPFGLTRCQDIRRVARVNAANA